MKIGPLGEVSNEIVTSFVAGFLACFLILGDDEARDSVEWLVGLFQSPAAVQESDAEEPSIAEYPWQLVRTCSTTYGYTLFDKATGNVYRDYYGPEGPDGLPETAGFTIVTRRQEPAR